VTGVATGQREDSFPHRYARTLRFTLGQPRTFTLAPDGDRVLFLRSRSGEDNGTCLWLLDTATGDERLLADPAALLTGAEEQLAPEERRRRERVREQAQGIVRYATDRAVARAVFPLGDRLFVADLRTGTVQPQQETGSYVDPRLDPAGQLIAFVRDGALHVSEVAGASSWVLLHDDDPEVTWATADFVAAEEIGRTRGYWWSPDGTRIVAARVDNGPVAHWHIADPTEPSSEPAIVAYPAAGTANAVVTLAVVDLAGERTDLRWDIVAYPYLVDVVWEQHGPLTLVVQSRDQRAIRILAADPDTGACTIVREDHDETWLEIVPGVPRWTGDGRLVHVLADPLGDARHLAVDGASRTGDDLHVRGVVDVDDTRAIIVASQDDPTSVSVWELRLDGAEPRRLSAAEGVHDAVAAGPALLLRSRTLDTAEVRTVVHSPAGDSSIPSVAAEPGIALNLRMLTLGSRALRAALLLPHEHDGGRLPVLLDPYGGPHGQRVVASQHAYLVSQWFADQGFAVLVVDGRGTPGRGLAWEQAVAGDLATAPLEDQVDALHAAAEQTDLLDLGRVAIRGWSFGGYLAALAVLRRPDVFSAAVAGAPVTDWSLYDTHYTERYLGMPTEQPDAYRRSSLLDDAARLERPLLLIHGMADDNVVAAHTLRLSRALLEAGRPHAVLPLAGVTHMTPQEVVAANLLTLQLDFLRQALRLA